MKSLIDLYKIDQESVYHTWFLHSTDRLKAFRTIRKGLMKVIKEIEEETFGNDFKGSSLEMVVRIPGVTQNAVQPGETYTYQFEASVPGAYWYHSHQDSVNQLDKGLYGALIVEGKSEEKVDKTIRFY